MSVCIIFDTMIPCGALLINFQFSAGIALLTCLKTNLYYKCILFIFIILSKYLTFMYIYDFLLGKALFLFPLTLICYVNWHTKVGVTVLESAGCV